MTRTLVCYGTGEGQTATVAATLAETLGELGHDVTVWQVTDKPAPDVTQFDAILVGSPIHMGKHERNVKQFVTTHLRELQAVPNGFFQVCLSAAVDDPERRAEAERYVDEFSESTGWTPGVVGIFAGAIRYSAYGFFKKRMMKKIAADATGDTDTSRDYEYTDWDAVDAFAREFAATVEAGVAPGVR